MSVLATLVLNVIPYMISFKYFFWEGGGGLGGNLINMTKLYILLSYFKYIMKKVDIKNTFTSFCIKNKLNLHVRKLKTSEFGGTRLPLVLKSFFYQVCQ